MQAAQVDPADKAFVINRIDAFGTRNEIQAQGRTPLISGPFNNWTPKPMTEIREFCNNINTEKMDIF